MYREMSTLSGGEIQRIFLHLHLESRLDSLIYVFDEPMAGLHPSEKQSIMNAVKELRDIGNTVIVVEHDREMIQQADYIIEVGPKAGIEGGEIVYQGSIQEYRQADTLLSRYLEHGLKERRREGRLNLNDCLILKHANVHYLKDLTVKFPLHAMVGIAGVSGSGKSSLIEDTLLKRLASASKYGEARNMEGIEKISGFARISQEPIGRSASSTPVSYIGVWDKIRDLFARQEKAAARGMNAGCFSFHSKGACPDCGGSGYERIFLTSDFSVDKQCPTCLGKRFAEKSLQITYQDKTIAEVLDMSITEACGFFADQSQITRPLRILEQMGMGYLTLGQPTSTLSGGESQRVKLAKELGHKQKGNLLYILDEPTTGLSLYDTELLMKLLTQLVNSGNSVLVIEHNTEVLRNCDYIIELGPEGGEKGGEIVAWGTPEELARDNGSITGKYLH